MKVVTALQMFAAALLLVTGAAGLLIFLYSWLLLGVSVAILAAGAWLLWHAMQTEARTVPATEETPDAS